MRRLALVAALFLASVSAWAEEASEDEGEETQGPNQYFQSITEGHRLYSGGEHEAALRSYRAALVERAGDPMATFLVACALRAQGQLDEAVESFQRAAELAAEDLPAIRANALMNVAWTQEARRELSAAREAWQAYVAYAESHQRVTTYVANARQRLAAITAIEELDAAYAPVRQRIAERAASQSESSE